MDDLIRECLLPLLNSDVDNEIIQYVKDMKVREDFEEFIDNIIDKNNPEHIKNYNVLISAKFGDKPPTSKKNRNLQCKSTDTPKSKVKDISYPEYTPPNSSESLNAQRQSGSSSGKRRQKFVDIKHFDSSIGMKKGRHPCNCETKIHALVNNCLKCGHIVCEQEGSGPCLFCDTMVCTNEVQSLLDSNSKGSSHLYNRLKEQKTSKEWKKAIEMRDRLVQADRNRDYKSKIYDDQSDYFNTNQIHKNKQDMKYALDLATRTIMAEEGDFQKNKKEFMKGVNKLLDTTETRFPKNVYESTNFPNGLSTKNNLELDKAEHTMRDEKTSTTYFDNIKVVNNVLLSEIDRRMCVSMHQPWASLLVAGIKIHEGRTWYTEHRGKLWIHAAGKEPDSNEILMAEEMYRTIYNDPDLVFPKRYPTSCLLGCVFVEDCLNQEKYRELNLHGESDSPYVLICTNPMILPIFFPMKGQHKIFQLNKEIHIKAKEAILASKWL